MDRPPVLLPFQYVEVAAHGFVSLVLTEDVGRQQLRFLFSYRGELRAMSWMTVGSDGSLYLNPRLRAKRSPYSGSAVADGAGGFTDVDLREVAVAAVDDLNPKLSHHASGVVNRTDHRSRGVSPRSVTENTLFRQDDYAHPSRFNAIPVDKLRPTDIVVPTVGGGPFELDEDRPLTSRIMVAPLMGGDAQVAVIEDDNVDRQTCVVAPFLNLRDCQDILYQVHFFNAPPSPWPEVTTMAVLDVEDAESDDAVRQSRLDPTE